MKEHFKKAFSSKIFVGVIYGIGIMILALLIFGAGVSVGIRKGEFANHMGDNYGKIFGDDQGGFFHDHRPNAHGTIGKIVKINLPEIVVAGNDGVEKSILTDDDTTIKHLSDDLKISDLKVDDYVLVVGTPNDQGQIQAKFIRTIPAPPLVSPSSL